MGKVKQAIQEVEEEVVSLVEQVRQVIKRYNSLNF